MELFKPCNTDDFSVAVHSTRFDHGMFLRPAEIPTRAGAGLDHGLDWASGNRTRAGRGDDRAVPSLAARCRKLDDRQVLVTLSRCPRRLSLPSYFILAPCRGLFNN